MPLHQPFQAAGQDHGFFLVDVISVKPLGASEPSMAICTEQGPIYITKAQAMEFFGLVEAEQVPVAFDEPDGVLYRASE